MRPTPVFWAPAKDFVYLSLALGLEAGSDQADALTWICLDTWWSGQYWAHYVVSEISSEIVCDAFSIAFDISRIHNVGHKEIWALPKAAFLQIINSWLFWYICTYGVSQMVFWGDKEFMKSSMKNSKISTTSWWQRFPVCAHWRDADGLRREHLTSLQRFWCLQIYSVVPQSSQWYIWYYLQLFLPTFLPAYIRLIPSGCSTLWTVKPRWKISPSASFLLEYLVLLEKVISPRPLSEHGDWNKWCDLAAAIKWVLSPALHRSFRSPCRRMEVHLLLMSKAEPEHIRNCSEVVCEWNPQCHY